MRKLLPVLLILLGAARLIAKDQEPALRLTRQEIQLLNEFAALKPGMTEEELRLRLPELSATYKEKPRPTMVFADTSSFTLAGIQWHGVMTLVDGRLQTADLYASAWKQPHPKQTGQSVPQHQMRAVEMLVASHYLAKFGRVVERYVPNVDCPAGDPFGLRHQWHLQDTAFSVDFDKNYSMSSIQISLSKWEPWEKEQRGLYSKWPLEIAPAHLLLEVSRP